MFHRNNSCIETWTSKTDRTDKRSSTETIVVLKQVKPTTLNNPLRFHRNNSCIETLSLGYSSTLQTPFHRNNSCIETLIPAMNKLRTKCSTETIVVLKLTLGRERKLKLRSSTETIVVLKHEFYEWCKLAFKFHRNNSCIETWYSMSFMSDAYWVPPKQ